MARLFSGTAGSFLQNLIAFGLTAAPVTLACFFKRTSAGNQGFLITVNNGSGSDYNYFNLQVFTDGLMYSVTRKEPTNVFQSETSNSTSWVHGLADISATNSRRGYVDGISANPANTSSATPTGISQLNVAVLNSFSTSNLFPGSMCAVAGWTAQLNADEKVSLAKGFSPRRIRPQSLGFYIPLVRELIELRTGNAFNYAGGTVADHPRMYGL